MKLSHFFIDHPRFAAVINIFITVFGLTTAKDTGDRANLMFGPEPGQGGTFMIARNPVKNPRPVPRAVIDHFCFTLSNWNEEQVRGAIKAKGLEISGGRDGSLHVYDPFNYDVQIASGAVENAFRR